MIRSRAAAVVGIAVLLGACAAAGPDYRRPEVGLPQAFKEAGPWRQADPRDDIARGAWWEAFRDPVLNALQARAQAGNLRLQAAAARVQQARALSGLADAGALPVVELAPDAARYRVSENRPDQPSKVPGNEAYTTDRFRLPLYASYEVDLWGRIARLREGAQARLEASQAAYHTVLLTLQGEVAQTYFSVRAMEDEARILADNLEARRRSHAIVDARRRSGLATEFDVLRVETELSLTQSELQAARRRRTELEHALAVLMGEAPEAFRLEDAPAKAALPVVPFGLPSDLLERRPDVAEAERLLAARNADIGVANAAFFPSIRLTGSVGFESADLSDLLRADSFIWGVAGGLVQPLFDGGRLRANRDRVEAAWQENLAGYRERLLVAFREVDDALAALRYLDAQHEALSRASAGARRAEQLAQARYRAGLVTVLEVVDAQRSRLQAERQYNAVWNQQLLASVALVKALGGGWEARAQETRAVHAAAR
ncbi:MAG: efflux transporter outer membrane subunit [Burkholderiales bacterium]|nr:efflux transporter outer membrane subunit [Burkholderiales bacterium]